MVRSVEARSQENWVLYFSGCSDRRVGIDGEGWFHRENYNLSNSSWLHESRLSAFLCSSCLLSWYLMQAAILWPLRAVALSQARVTGTCLRRGAPLMVLDFRRVTKLPVTLVVTAASTGSRPASEHLQRAPSEDHDSESSRHIIPVRLRRIAALPRCGRLRVGGATGTSLREEDGPGPGGFGLRDRPAAAPCSSCQWRSVGGAGARETRARARSLSLRRSESVAA